MEEARIRRTAFNTTCNHCGKEHHFERVCRAKNSAKSTRATDDTAVDNTRTMCLTNPQDRMSEMSVESEDTNSAHHPSACQSCLAISTKDLDLDLKMQHTNPRVLWKKQRQMVYVTDRTDKLFLSRGNNLSPQWAKATHRTKIHTSDPAHQETMPYLHA